MIKMEKIKIDFGRPEDGWVIINIKIGNFELEIDTSDVPNPIQQLCRSINFSLNNMEFQILFSLEPNFNVFRFSPKNGLIIFQILFLEKNQKTLMKEIKGSFEEIVLPFYRAIKRFLTLEYDEKHWGRISDYEMGELDNLINKYKTSYE